MSGQLPMVFAAERESDLLARGMEFFRNLFNKKRRSRVAFWDLVERAEDHLRRLDAANQARWDLAAAPRQIDWQRGLVTFGSGEAELTVPAQVVGVLSHGRPIWRWAWGNPSVPAGLTRSAAIVRGYGERHDIPQLRQACFEASLVEAWGLVALTCLLARAQGAYCEDTGDGLVFFVFGFEPLAMTAAAGADLSPALPIG